MVTVDELLAEPTLDLTLVHRAKGDSSAIRCVATSELPRPDDFLTGGELLLTTGLSERSPAEWLGLVRRLVALPVSGLCFGTGLVHERVPAALLRAARKHDLTLLRSDVSVPFVQISQWVIERQVALREQASRRLIEQQGELVRRLLDGGDLRGVLRGIHGPVAGGRLRVVEPDGTLLARFPATGKPPGWVTAQDALDLPVLIHGRLVAHLQSEQAPADSTLAHFAATVLGLELARRQAWLAGSRELVGHVIEDALDRVVPDAESERRLAHQGVGTSRDLWVIVGRSPTSTRDLAEVPGLLSAPGITPTDPDAGDPRLAVVRALPTAVVADPDVVASTAASLLERLSRSDPEMGVGVSGPHTGIDGLRLGWLAASAAAELGAGVTIADRSSLSWFVLAAAEGALDGIVDRMLGPLRRHDERHGSELVRTVRSYLQHDGAVRAVAADLGLHPNTVRQRLHTIERVSESSLTRTDTRVELSLALRVSDLA